MLLIKIFMNRYFTLVRRQLFSINFITLLLQDTCRSGFRKYQFKKSAQYCNDEPKNVSREAFISVIWHNSLKFYICGLSGIHSFWNYDIPTGNFAVPCSISFNTMVNILRRYPIAEFLQVLLLCIDSKDPFNPLEPREISVYDLLEK